MSHPQIFLSDITVMDRPTSAYIAPPNSPTAGAPPTASTTSSDSEDDISPRSSHTSDSGCSDDSVEEKWSYAAEVADIEASAGENGTDGEQRKRPMVWRPWVKVVIVLAKVMAVIAGALLALFLVLLVILGLAYVMTKALEVFCATGICAILD